MWQQYRRTAPVIQAFILLFCAAIYFLQGRRWDVTIYFFVVLQIGALVGAAWGWRMKRRNDRVKNELPLKRR